MLRVPVLKHEKKLKSIAVLTSGGDAPGMNAAIRAVVRYGICSGAKVFGIMRGYSGLLEGDIREMELSSVANVIQRGGTILKTSRSPEFLKPPMRKKAAAILREKQIDALVVIGGEGSFAGAHLLEKETGFPTMGVPGTIDNDVFGSDDTIGFDTAVNTGLEAIDRIRDTASSHDRLFLLEVMGRSSGFIAMMVGIGGGAETIVVPEQKTTIQDISRAIDRGVRRGKKSSIIVVAEGKEPALSTRIARELSKRKYSPKVCILGHIQRGGVPTAHDRFLASTLGAAAVEYLLAGRSNAMVAVQCDQVTLVAFEEITGRKKALPKETLRLAKVLAT